MYMTICTGTFVLRQKSELFLAHGRLCSLISLLLDHEDQAKEMVELDGIEPTT
jgi:hypothetical protein